jgi:hypothetical protein
LLSPSRLTWLVVAAMLAAAAPVSACPGDCDGDGRVAIAELLAGVGLALRGGDIDACPSLDRDANRRVDVGELIAAVEASLGGCPTPTPSRAPSAPPSVTFTATRAPSPTATRTPPVAPVVLCHDVYRTYAERPIRLPLPALDPDGGALTYDARNLPRGAALDVAGLLDWTPGERQLGGFHVPFTAADDSQPPRSAAGVLAFQVLPPDPCVVADCDPASGCATAPLPLATGCCGEDEERRRIVEPVLPCPAGRLLHIGRNGNGFGRMQSCDRLRVINFLQIGAVVALNLEARCVDVGAPVTAHLRLETATRVLFDHSESTELIPANEGFARIHLQPIEVLGPPPFFEFEGAEALLSASLTDAGGVTVARQVRVVLTFGRPTELTDQPPTTPRDPPGPCVTPSSTAK